MKTVLRCSVKNSCIWKQSSKTIRNFQLARFSSFSVLSTHLWKFEASLQYWIRTCNPAVEAPLPALEKYGARKNCVNYGLQVIYFCFIVQGGVQIL